MALLASSWEPMQPNHGGKSTMENITWISIRMSWSLMEMQSRLTYNLQILSLVCYCRLTDNWWIDFGPTPSADAHGLSGVCHDIVGTDGLAFR